MNPIAFPLEPGSQGPAVADLQDALLLLISRQLIQTFPAPNRPTAEELRALSERIKLERMQSGFGDVTRQLLRHFQNQQGLGDHLAGIVEATTAAALNRILADLGVLGQAQSFAVSGRVYSADRAGVGGLRVQVVDKNAGPDVLLAEGSSKDAGEFGLSFTAATVVERGKEAPDIQVRVLSGEALLGVSEVRYNAGPAEALDVLLPAAAGPTLPSEHATLTGAISGHFSGKLADLQETRERSDISYLANKTGWDARAVALAALADQFSARTTPASGAAPAIEPAFFYALFRAGLPADEEVLYRADAKAVEGVWTRAVEQGVIPGSLAGRIPEVVAQFQALSAQKLLTAPALAGVSSLKEMLASSELTDSQQQQFAALYTANRADLAAFWDAIGTELGTETAARLQLDGKLAYLTLNNVRLMARVRGEGGGQGLSDPVQLAAAGFHRAARWGELLNADTLIPTEIPGDTPEARRSNYADFLAAQVRLSYPTAAVAEMVRSGDLQVEAPGPVHDFLTEHQGRFEIGAQPVEQFIARNNLQVGPETVAQVKRLQRVYQITPSDQALAGLLKRGVDAAYHVVRFEKEDFVQSFAPDLGGAEQAALVYDRARQVHNATLNIAVSYLAASNGIPLGASPLAPGADGSEDGGQLLRPAPTGPSAENASDVLAYPTLESLLGSMDFCACDHCRSILSPAAYLVDLLQFIDRAPTEADKENPQAVLLECRPDLQHLPLTCENTNTALPYIDLVNETLEYFIANGVERLSLAEYTGHDTDGVASEDLMASPQFVMDTAYTVLREERFPLRLPFHQPLESLRRLFERFEVPLSLAMERLRKTENLEHGNNPYGWLDILMEEIGLSREEYEILTDFQAVPLWRMYGFLDGTSTPAVTAALSNARQFARRMGLSYEELAALLRTRFINPNSDLIPKLERLGLSFATLEALKQGTISPAEFDALLPTGARAPDPDQYGGDIKAWVRDQENIDRIMAIVTLADPTGSSDECDFDQLELRFSKPAADTSTRLGHVEYTRLLRFIRLWRKTGWSIEQTDAAICALFRADREPLRPNDADSVPELNEGFKILVPRLGIVKRVMRALNLKPDRDLLPLLACWSEISTHGDHSLYGQMFLNPAILNQDPVFSDDGHGGFLTDADEKVAGHREALRAAFNLTSEEFDQIYASLGFEGDTPLALDRITDIYRRGRLARMLRLSVRELLLLTSQTGLDPFDLSAPTDPPILRLIALVRAMRDRSLKPTAALYLLWNQDLSGRSAPDPTRVSEFARTLRGDFIGIDHQLTVSEDPAEDSERARIALVYGAETAAALFSLLENTVELEVPYTHGTPSLEPAITTVGPSIAYDDFRHLLLHRGLLDAATRDALNGVAGISAEFKNAVDGLFARSEDVSGSFFTRYPELRPLNETLRALDQSVVLHAEYTQPEPALAPAITAVDPGISYDDSNNRLAYTGILTAARRDALKSVTGVTAAFQAAVDTLFLRSQEARAPAFAALQPELARRRKSQQALERLSGTVSLDTSFARALLGPETGPYPLHAVGKTDQPALNDVIAIETQGLSAQFFFRDTATGDAELTVPAEANLDYSAAGANPLPPNPQAGEAVSGIWQGAVEPPEPGHYNLVIEADAGAAVSLSFAGEEQSLTRNGTIWRNAGPLQLKAGTLYEITLKVEKVRDRLSAQWETPKRPREVIPGRYLYPRATLAPFGEVYTRFLKAASLASRLRLTAGEIAHLAAEPDYRIGGQGWLNALAVSGDPTPTTAAALRRSLEALLDFARIKADLSPEDETLLAVLQEPATADGTPSSQLLALTGWDSSSLQEVVSHLGGTVSGLAGFEPFRRVYDALEDMRPIGVSGSALIRTVTNAPDGGVVRDFQAALRARHAAADWRTLIQPINDAMRGLQRDALVASILHQMREKPETAQIDTPDKLFEYFLMDVQMEPCMLTSRVRHALSSVQLFIERCLMNLERRVSPASINAQHWDSMKRYRRWEVVRNLFIWPENWLEPELRDDKTPFFKELESELLQGDLTDDSAATALLNYLAKLEEIAKLEPCGLHYEEPTTTRGGVLHVVARTAGAGRKYYYSRCESGYCTSLEQIELDIEDNPVVPYVWNGRLLLFWLRLLKRSDSSGKPSGGKSLISLNTNDLPSQPAVTVQAVLCWSEYYNGKWQAPKTSDVNLPTTLHTSLPESFDRSAIRLKVRVEGDALRIYVRETPFRPLIGGIDIISWPGSFLFYNTHSLPVRGDEVAPVPPAPVVERRDLGGDNRQSFALRYSDPKREEFSREILGTQIPFHTIDPRHELRDAWNAPLFFSDSRHVFLISSEERPVFVRGHGGFGIFDQPGVLQPAEIPPLVVETAPSPKPKPWGDGGAVIPDSGVVDSAPIRRFVTEDAYIRQGLATTLNVRYGDREIGPFGSDGGAR